MNYDKFSFFLPPRPEHKITPSLMLSKSFQKDWVAQAKMNGTYNFIGIAPDKSMHCLKRDGTPHLQWAPGPENVKAFANLPGDGWYVFMAELLNDKTPHIKNINYIHDVIVDCGELLVGSTYLERHIRLRSLFESTKHPDYDHYEVIDDNTWLATIYKNSADFGSVYARLIQQPEIEGFVLKQTTQQLSMVDMCRGMVKIRKPTKNYGF